MLDKDMPCRGLPGQETCCTVSKSPCTLGQGDCDEDSQCAEGLVCGEDNCKNFNTKGRVQ